MKKILVAVLISTMGLCAFANDFGGGNGDQNGDQNEEISSTWTCFADNAIQKGFMGHSTSKSIAMKKAMARCEVASQLPCFESVCRKQ